MTHTGHSAFRHKSKFDIAKKIAGEGAMYRTNCSVVTSVAIAILVSGCVSESETELEANKNLIRQFIAETDAQNFGAYDQLWSDDVIAHFPNGVDMDRQTAEENERAFAVAFSDASRSIDQLLAEGDRVILRETLRGTHNGPFGDIQPTGNPIEVTANVIYRVSDGKIAESWVEADLGTFAAGLVEASTANDVVDTVAKAIQASTDEWIDVAATGDVDGYFEYVTEDFIWLGDYSGPGYSGHQAVREFLEPFFETLIFSMENVTSEDLTISEDGDNAIHRYSGTAVIESKESGDITRYKRRYVDFWRKGQDGIWRCSRHLYLVVG